MVVRGNDTAFGKVLGPVGSAVLGDGVGILSIGVLPDRGLAEGPVLGKTVPVQTVGELVEESPESRVALDEDITS